jgi:hypothetical protein
MKLLKIKVLVILLTSVALHSNAQTSETKQPIFSAYPNSISVDNLTLANSVMNAKGTDVTLNLAEGFKFKGSVISNIQNQANLQIITMRSSENPNTLLEISKITNEDNSIFYKGRILNSGAADGYELKNINGNYSLEKFELAKILQQCKQ